MEPKAHENESERKIGEKAVWTKIKLVVSALALMFVVDVATLVVQSVATNETVLAWMYTIAFLINAVAFVAAYIVLWRWPAPAGGFTDPQKRWIKVGLWLTVVQFAASIAFIAIQWSPSLGLSDDAMTVLSFIPMIVFTVENVVATGFVIWKWN